MAKFATLLLGISLLLLPLVTAQLSGRVGPLTTRASKQVKVCNVLNYGVVASKTADIGPALLSAFNACKNGGTSTSALHQHFSSSDGL
jgi:rhamnogalacturonan hydrolase